MKKTLLCIVVLFSITALYAQNRIIVSKKDFRLVVITPEQDTVCCYKCAVGSNLGNKEYVGDRRTPEGTFSVKSIEDSRLWKHDFNDGAGMRPYAYGPYFIRLKTPIWRSIGIHGTCFPESIGTRCSEGCVRLRNEDVAELIKHIKVGDKVIIEKDILE